MNRILLVAAAGLSLCACTSFKDDVVTICDAPDKIGDTTNMKPSQRMELMGQYCSENVKSKEGKDFLWVLSSSGRGARNKMLRVQAARFGINPCHLADIP